MKKPLPNHTKMKQNICGEHHFRNVFYHNISDINQLNKQFIAQVHHDENALLRQQNNFRYVHIDMIY